MPTPPAHSPHAPLLAARRLLGWPALLLVIALPAALFLPGLGSSGLAHSEAFRAQPAWEMLANHDWLVVRLFEQPYLRKPPGIIWAIAACSTASGETAFAARLVSVLAMIASAILSWWFGRRWFGGMAGLVAGLATTLFPLLTWYPPVSRSAEIEALHNMFVLGAMLTLVDILLGELRTTNVSHAPRASDAPSRLAAIAHALALGAACAGALLTKGPAGLPALAGVLVVGVGVRRAMRLTMLPRVWLAILAGLALGVATFAAWWLAAARALERLAEPVVLQAPGEFLFDAQRVLGIVTLVPVALVSALPLSLLLLFLPWRTHAAPASRPTTQRLARALGLMLLAGLAVSMLAGISNPRYVLPVLMLTPSCVGGAVWWLSTRPRATPRSRRMFVMRIASSTAFLTLALAIIAWRGEVRRAVRTSGEPAGLALGAALVRDMQARGVASAHLLGDQMIDTRPEVLIAAQRVVREAGLTLCPRWKPLLLEPGASRQVPLTLPAAPPLPEVGSYVIVRLDMERRPSEPPAEWGLYQSSGVLAQLEPVFEGKVHNFPFRVFRRVR